MSLSPDPTVTAEIVETLAWLRTARTVNPDHPAGIVDRHVGCDVCTGERRLAYKLDQIPRAVSV